MRRLVCAAVLAWLAIGARAARAYPQYQIGRETTCTGCHLAPDGGGILTENGLAVAESTSWRPGKSAWMYGALDAPAWLQLGGDARLAAGFVDPGVASAAAYPMQIEVAANAGAHGFSVTALGGLRSPQEGGSVIHTAWSRQHYAMWQSNPGATSGVYVRVGRLMPTYGLRLAEHIAYTQRFGGEPLYGEVYAAAVSYVSPIFEAHATAFVHDSLDVTTEHGDGGALYAEVRLGEHAALGVEGKYAKSTDAVREYGGMTGKLYVPALDVQFQAEAEVIRQHVTAGAGDRFTQLAGYVLASRPLGSGFLLDVGAGHFTQDTRVKGLYRDCVDANLHWFMTSHVEWLLTTRVELLDGASGPNGGYALAQIHYRL